MKRYDLREHKTEFLPRMVEIMTKEIQNGENAIFLFEIGDFTPIQASADCVKENKWTLMNSLKFNEVDWTIVVKKEQPPVEAVEAEETEENK